MSFKIAILGASGYTGAELVRLISTHPSFEIVAISAKSKAGKSMSSVFPHLRHLNLPALKTFNELDFSGVDICFCALPHTTSQQVISVLPRTIKIVDLSADFRLNDFESYKKWYGIPHLAPDLQKEAVYGLTEFYRREIAKARLVAGTGCNAATGQYILRPLIKDEVVELHDIILDLKCGVSGAGRSMRESLLYSEVSEGYNAYAVGGAHRHLGEFDQELSKVAGKEVKIQFTPHLIPANRGILATAYVKGSPQEVHESLSKAYEQEVFVEVLPFGETPATRHVRGSNFCHIGVCGDRIPGRTTIVAALDNLTKGASGQAVQNANVMLGVEETAGLMMAPVFP